MISLGTITTKGQVVIPYEIREYLRLKPGTRLRFSLEEDDKLTVERVKSIKEAYGMIKSNKSGLSDKDYKGAVRDATLAKYKLRSKK